MTYKVGDKVRVKDTFIFNRRAESYISFLEDRTTKVKRISGDKYFLKGLIDLEWREKWIEEVFEPIRNRYEILDLRGYK